jgi:hypothetical protein
MESKELREKIVVTIQKCNMGSPDELANQILALLPDRVDRDELIEARAKYINDVLTIGTSKVYSGNVYWYEMDGIDKEPYIKQATADVDWFLSHGGVSELDYLLQAQNRKTLQEVITWSDDICPHFVSPRRKRNCPKCWEALKKVD